MVTRVGDIPTPALVVDVGALDRNIRRMADFFSAGPCRLRPHFKAHKTPEIARRQLAAGSCVGLTCATVSEAEVAAEFCDDLLIANEPIGPRKCDRVAALAGRVRTTIAVDSIAGLEAISAAARAAGVTVGVLVDLNVGQMRCGVLPGAAAATLAKQAAGVAGVELRGVMGYEGHVVSLRAAGLPCAIVSAGGTGTYDISGRIEGITEIQAGSYALMDTDYGRLDVPFEQAFWAIGTIVSRPDAGRCVADCGHKSMTKDHGLPTVRGVEGASVVSLNDEHATITIPADSRVAVGDRVFLRPSHTDPTMNLHDVVYALEDERVVGVWPIAARGYPEHRRSG
jgi:D-serine deaminase-like pyridoxal phosphate-dependent protein